MAEVETLVRQALETVRMETENTKQLMENVSASEANLDSKIEKKRIELERNQKRLQTLKKVRCVLPWGGEYCKMLGVTRAERKFIC
jgi:clusterin-associated protein 1